MGPKLKLDRNSATRIVVGLVIVVGVYILGVNVGNGNVHNPFSSSLSSENGNLPNKLDYSTVNQVYQSLKGSYYQKLTATQLENGIKHGLAQATNDPYTEYFTPAEAKEFNDELNNTFSGIGAELGEDTSGNLQVIAPIAGSPAASAGLQADDIITSINGKSTSGISVDQAVDEIRGNAGTTVTLQVVRKAQTLTFNIKRQNIVVPSVTSKILSGNIGYMQITTFADDTAALAQKDAAQFKAEGVKGIVLDLRDDPGGELSAAESVSSLWLPEGQVILQEKRGTTVLDTDLATGGDVLNGIPTVVLINAGSASASEITAGALHDHKDAYLIGEKSYGKGVVQQLINFSDGSQLKVTIASWYRPDGENINHKGITPDEVVSEPSDATATNDAQLTAAESYLASH